MGASVPGDVGFVKNTCGNPFFFQMVAVLDSVLEEAQKEENEDEVVRMEHILQAVCLFV